jgi:hypothetical protein
MSVTSSLTSGSHELVLGAVDLDGRDRGALQRAEKDAAQRVAEGDAIAALERLGHELAVRGGQRVAVHDEVLRTDEIAPVLLQRHSSFLVQQPQRDTRASLRGSPNGTSEVVRAVE